MTVLILQYIFQLPIERSLLRQVVLSDTLSDVIILTASDNFSPEDNVLKLLVILQEDERRLEGSLLFWTKNESTAANSIDAQMQALRFHRCLNSLQFSLFVT